MEAGPVDATRVHYNPLVWLAGDTGGTKTLLGLVVGEEARLTHIEWNIGAAEIAARFGTPRVRILRP